MYISQNAGTFPDCEKNEANWWGQFRNLPGSNKKRHRIGKSFLPILCPLSVVSFAVLGLSGDGIDPAPGGALGGIHFALFLLGKLLVGNEFFHCDSSFWFLRLS